MLTATANQTVDDVLSMFIAQDRAFTAFDITVAARTKTQERIDHRDVRSMVHNNWIMANFPDHFERTEGIELSVDGNPLVIVYHPDIKNGYDHPLALRSGLAGQPVPAPQTPIHSTPVAGGAVRQSDNSYTCTPTNEGRINIPRSLIDRVDKSGGSVDFMVSGTLHPRTPNKDGRVRINLQKLDFDAGDPVTVTISADERSITLSA